MNGAARQLARKIGRGNSHLARSMRDVGRRPAGYRSEIYSLGGMKGTSSGKVKGKEEKGLGKGKGSERKGCKGDRGRGKRKMTIALWSGS